MCVRQKFLLEVLTSFSLKLKMIMLSKQIMLSCYTNLKARVKPSSTVFPHSKTNIASCIRSTLDPNNVGTEHEESLVPRIPLDCNGWRSSGIKFMMRCCSNSQLCKNLVTSICLEMVLKWWFTSFGSSLIANCNVLSLLHAETVRENVRKHFSMEFNPHSFCVFFIRVYTGLFKMTVRVVTT